jgi:AcrR family transcriptional regulator
MSEPSHTADGRREAGERTRQRLIDATLDVLAERGESGASLRVITEAADANVAAVSYHFGSKEALVRSAIEQSMDRLLEDQVSALRALNQPTIDDIAEAWCRPVIRAVAASPCPEQVFMRVAGQTMATCVGERRVQVNQHSSGAVDQLTIALAGVLPDLDDEALHFRAGAVGSILTHVTSGNAGFDGKPAEEIEQLLVPVVAGALRGTTAR